MGPGLRANEAQTSCVGDIEYIRRVAVVNDFLPLPSFGTQKKLAALNILTYIREIIFSLSIANIYAVGKN